MTNRLGITVRFNRDEQQDMRAMMAFWQTTDPKWVIRFALQQLKTAMKEINNKLQAQQEEQNDKMDGVPDGGVSASNNDVVSIGDSTSDEGTEHTNSAD